jgi:hypothetical protein
MPHVPFGAEMHRTPADVLQRRVELAAGNR